VCKTPENSTQDTPIRLELSSASHLSRVESRIWGGGLQQVPSRCSGRNNCYTVGIYFPEAGDLLHIATMQQCRPNWKRSKTFCSPIALDSSFRQCRFQKSASIVTKLHILGRIACIARMWPIATDGMSRSRVCVCVRTCVLAVGHIGQPCKKRLNQFARGAKGTLH